MSAYSDAVLADTPVGYWRLNDASGSIVDSSGSSLPGTASGSPTYHTTGGPATADASNGYLTLVAASSQKVDFGDDNKWSVSNTNLMTWEFWVKFTTSINGYCLTKGNSGSNYEYQINPSGTTALEAEVWTSGASDINRMVTADATVLSAGTWYHIVFTYDHTGSRVGKAYVNGVDVTGGTGTSNAGGTYANGTAAMQLGHRVDDTGTYTNASFSEVAVYNSVLSAARVLAHYNAAFTDPNVTVSPPVAGTTNYASIVPSVSAGADVTLAPPVAGTSAYAGKVPNPNVLAPVAGTTNYAAIVPTVTATTIPFAFRSSTGMTGPSGSGVTMTIPSGVIDGDLIFVAISSAAAQGVNTPAGWTAYGIHGAGNVNISIFSKIASSEPSTVLFATNGSGTLVGTAVAYSGQRLSVNAVNGTNGLPGTVIPYASITPTATPSIIVAFSAIATTDSSNNPTQTSPSGFTNRTTGAYFTLGLNTADIAATGTGVHTVANTSSSVSTNKYTYTIAIVELPLPASVTVSPPVATTTNYAAVVPTVTSGRAPTVDVPIASTTNYAGNPPAISISGAVTYSPNTATTTTFAGVAPTVTTTQSPTVTTITGTLSLAGVIPDIHVQIQNFAFIRDDYVGLAALDAFNEGALASLNFGALAHGEEKKLKFRLANKSTQATRFDISATSTSADIPGMVSFSVDNDTFTPTLSIVRVAENTLSNVIWVKFTTTASAYLSTGTFLIKVVQSV